MGSLNFLRTRVHRAEDWVGLKEVRVATAIIKGADLFQCLEFAIDGLRDRGWVVDDLEAFQIDISPNQLAGDAVLLELCEMAEAGGFAYRIEESGEYAPATASEAYCQPMGS